MALMDLVKELRDSANAIEKMIEQGHAFDRHLGDSMVLSFAKTLSQNQDLQDALAAASRAGIKIVVSAGGYGFIPSQRVNEPKSTSL